MARDHDRDDTSLYLDSPLDEEGEDMLLFAVSNRKEVPPGFEPGMEVLQPLPWVTCDPRYRYK